ncbi:hypothetical protein NDU88_005991 [Pleurodeles waltl]|uniref:Homeobox domain-containing protein n=1 Tax=Pleurodeles waltl TaxID=8319 RepID=A0AAV7WC44_PLEWA|nr:hypothetical protein NDU88_005991 [Pleurodeles waltl]
MSGPRRPGLGEGCSGLAWFQPLLLQFSTADSAPELPRPQPAAPCEAPRGAGVRRAAPRSPEFSSILQSSCKRKEQEPNKERNNSQKKSRLVFTDLQRRTLFAIFKENKRPSKEMQITISQQLGLELTTVSNFFMNARRRSLEKWQDDLSTGGSSSTSSTCTKA